MAIQMGEGLSMKMVLGMLLAWAAVYLGFAFTAWDWMWFRDLPNWTGHHSEPLWKSRGLLVMVTASATLLAVLIVAGSADG